MENIFIEMLKQSVDELRSGKLPKGKFIGKYTERLNKIDKENAFRFKRPQVIGDSKDPNNNWIDYILSLNEEEYTYFNITLNN